jgi:hypothetical protein
MTRRRHDESDLVEAIRQALPAMGVLCFRNNVGVARYPGSLVRYGLGTGSADLICCYKGRFLAIECKSMSGRQSHEQVCWQRAVESAGGLYILARSLQDVTKRIAPCL